ncbi:putative hydrolase of the HAD superfamily [Methylomarinovum caldicuralii]|uniref:Hydrolase of the HAD superfamily n=1 Tax=Methylomarinovum caldicuralii TaxID=438856 RepID=A0AAU9C728_9GAMM|nr:HAD family phosphatase [Methylomarinovum caldicuralii]BCX81186.1 putative hydrolase of the HAD superfamily [Methylomarinovum caldicuralii]
MSRNDNLDGIKAVLFDFGGVIAEEGFRDGLRALARQQGLDEQSIFEAGMDAVYDSGWVTGRGTEADFWRLMAEWTGLKGDPVSLRAVILERFRVRLSMLALVDRLRRAGYVVGLLSDQTEWLDELDRRYRIYDHFDRLYVSYRLGKGKRDPSLFDDIARDLNLAPEEILFIDDSPGNVERARRRGWRALLFQDEADLRRRLREMGIPLP